MSPNAFPLCIEHVSTLLSFLATTARHAFTWSVWTPHWLNSHRVPIGGCVQFMRNTRSTSVWFDRSVSQSAFVHGTSWRCSIPTFHSRHLQRKLVTSLMGLPTPSITDPKTNVLYSPPSSTMFAADASRPSLLRRSSALSLLNCLYSALSPLRPLW